jgi:2-polyprenyl-6-methoxyphenol hydroxylase-like FAD-dependent oxidoreductase
MATIETILVVGGGIAGLTTAAALHRHGFTTELVERQQTWQALGAGFLVHPNGMRMLLSLGLATGVEHAGAVVRRWQFCDEQETCCRKRILKRCGVMQAPAWG